MRKFRQIYLAERGVVGDFEEAGAILEFKGGGGSLLGSKMISTFIGLPARVTTERERQR